MKPQSFYSLESKTLLVATRPGQIQGVTYDAGTIGVIERVHNPSEGSGRIIRFTRSLSFDFAYFDRVKWEILKHCATCLWLVMETELTRCERCMRPDYCRTCIETHNCTVPTVGLSREPRHIKPKGR